MSSRAGQPVVLVCVHNEVVRRDLVTTGILATLSSRYNLQFLVSGNVDRTELEKIGRVVAVYRPRFLRSWIWNNLWILSSIHQWAPITGRLAKEYFNRKKTDNYSPLLRFLVFANTIGFAPFLIALGRFTLAATVNRAVDDGQKLGWPDVIVAPTGLRDLIADDVVRWGVRRKIPTLFLQINSDVFNMKVPTARAAYFAIWGDQSWYLARLVCRYPPSRLKIVGSPRFDIYERHRVSKADARRILDIPEDAIVLLFCGATSAFDEIRALQQLEAAVQSGILPENVLVLYKPHPKGQVKGATTAFNAADFKHIRLAPDVLGVGRGALEVHPMLMSGSDAVISPYSTMGVEGAMHGLPVLCLGYHPGRFESYWRWAREFSHLQIYRDKVWCINCHHEHEFIPGVQALLKLVGDPLVAEAAKNEVRSVAIRDGRCFAERLSQCLDEILAEGTWKPA